MHVLHTARATSVIACFVVLLTAGPAGLAQTQPAPVIPDNVRLLEGLPAVRVDATQEGAIRRTLDSAEAEKHRLKIDVVDGRYYWTSRGNQLLTTSSSGGFIYLSSTEPGHYVRLRRVNDRVRYVEHVDMEFGSVTYWGELRIVLGKKKN